MTVETAVAAPAEPRGLGIQRRLVELGRIRLGEKGSKGEPRKLSKFRLTSASRPLLEAARRVYGGQAVRAWQGAPDDGMWELYTDADSIDVMVPPTINAYSQFYEIWDAGGCTLRCDGLWESIAEEPCSHGDHEGMKVTTRVSVILPKLPGIGTWRLETHGWNAAATLPATLDLIGQAGRWIPAVIRLEQRSSTTRDEKTNRVLKRRFVVPVIDLAGVSFFEMLESGQVSDEYQAPTLGAGPGALALPPGPARPPASSKVNRPEMADEPELEDETAPLSTPVDRSFPEEPADESMFAGAAAPAATPDLAESVRASAEASELEGVATDEQQGRLNGLLIPLGKDAAIAGVTALWPDAAADGKLVLTAARADALIKAAESLGDRFPEQWRSLAGEAVPA